MFEQNRDTGERASSDASNAAYQSLFADAYGFRQSGQERSAAKQAGPAAPSTELSSGSEANPDGLKEETAPGEYDDFQYEMIFRDVQPLQHTMAQGDTLEAVARQHLGAGASEQDVQNHVQEIQRINGGQVTVGQQIVMPGHTASGDVLMPNKDGTTYTISGDPVERYRQAQQFQAEHHKPPEWAAGSQPAEQGTGGQDPNQGCYEARVEYQYAVRDQQGRIQLRDVRYSYMRCPPDFRRQQ